MSKGFWAALVCQLTYSIMMKCHVAGEESSAEPDRGMQREINGKTYSSKGMWRKRHLRRGEARIDAEIVYAETKYGINSSWR